MRYLPGSLTAFAFVKEHCSAPGIVLRLAKVLRNSKYRHRQLEAYCLTLLKRHGKRHGTSREQVLALNVPFLPPASELRTPTCWPVERRAADNFCLLADMLPGRAGTICYGAV